MDYNNQILQIPFTYAVLGGTFDVLHAGHRFLLEAANVLGDTIHVGLTSDKYVKDIRKGHEVTPYQYRKLGIESYFFHERIDVKRLYIYEINDKYGDLINSDSIYNHYTTVVIASEETYLDLVHINAVRRSKKLEPFYVFVIPIMAAEDGRQISSTRIRNGEIKTNGEVIKK